MKIGAYVVSKQAKANYAHESYDVRAWPGFEMVLHSARLQGYEIDYVSEANAHTYDIVLMSITSDCDWWPFVAERVRWPKSNTRVIVGGPGVLNVRPFLSLVDVFVLGRAEYLIIDLLKAELSGNKLDNNSIIYNDEFSAEKKYTINQVDKSYPYTVTMSNGKPFTESSIGCPNKCFFCGYTWQRKYIGDGSFSAGAESMNTGNRERTIADLLKLPPEQWQNDGPLRIVGLDGTSERLRYKVNKRISRDMWRQFLEGLSYIPKPHQVKIYNIIGYPGETEEDWQELLEDIIKVDTKIKPQKQWSLLCHFTPFRAMPATPCATWPIAYRNYRGVIAKTLKTDKASKGNIIIQGNAFWAVESMGTDSLPSVIQSVIVLRGIESDIEVILKLAASKKYWGASTYRKLATLESVVNCHRLFKEQSKDELATRYLDYTHEGGSIPTVALQYKQ